MSGLGRGDRKVARFSSGGRKNATLIFLIIVGRGIEFIDFFIKASPTSSSPRWSPHGGQAVRRSLKSDEERASAKALVAGYVDGQPVAMGDPSEE